MDRQPLPITAPADAAGAAPAARIDNAARPAGRDRAGSGGRVFGADASEITRATEAEFDKRVLRVRFRTN